MALVAGFIFPARKGEGEDLKRKFAFHLQKRRVAFASKTNQSFNKAIGVRRSMRTIVQVATLGIFVLGAASCASLLRTVEEYDLGEKVDEKHRVVVAPSITRQIVDLERNPLEDDRSQHLWSDVNELLAADNIDLDGDGVHDWLVYPAKYTPTFFGAHSIACWIFKGEKNGNHRLVLEGRHDLIRILRSTTNGMRDIELEYWAAEREVYRYAFDGNDYELQPRSP